MADVPVRTAAQAPAATAADVPAATAVEAPAATAATPAAPRYDDDYGTAAPPPPRPGEAAPAPPRPRRTRQPVGHLGVDVALRTLVVPDHAGGFWDELAHRLADEPQLRLRPRAAVRRITEPPPITDDRPLTDAELLAPRRRRRRRRRRLVAVLVVVIAGGAGAVAYQEANAPVDEDAGAPGVTTTVPASTVPGQATTVPVPFDPAATVGPGGVEHLRVGSSLGDLVSAGLMIEADRPTFVGSGGTCYDARLRGADDLLLRFASPDRATGVSRESDGILASVTVSTTGAPTMRTTEAGIGLGATEDQVRAAYPQGLTQADHPFVPGDHVLTYDPADGSGNGIAFHTHAGTVTSVSVGALSTITAPEGCG